MIPRQPCHQATRQQTVLSDWKQGVPHAPDRVALVRARLGFHKKIDKTAAIPVLSGGYRTSGAGFFV